jgi:hypothetical protein
MFKPEWVRVTAPLYAASKGVALAAISAVFELMCAAGGAGAGAGAGVLALALALVLSLAGW